MSEASIPKQWKEAAPNVIWFVLVLGFGLELVSALVRAEWARSIVSLAGLVLLMALVIHWERIRALAKVSDAKFIVLLMVLALIALPLSSYFKTEFEGAISWGLIVLAAVSAAMAAMLCFRHLRIPKSQVVTAPAPDGQVHRDLLLLLDFAVHETTARLLSDLIDHAPRKMPDDEKLILNTDANQAKSDADFVRHVSIKIGHGTFRHQEFLSWMSQAEGEAERQLQLTPESERPHGDPLDVRRFAIANLQFIRTMQFLRKERRELEEKIIQHRQSLLEQLRHRSPD